MPPACRTTGRPCAFIKRSSVSSGGAGAEGLRGQRGLGDLPVLRGPGAGHPDRPAASAPLLAPVLPTRAQGRRLHRPRAPRLRQRRPRQQQRPQQVPAPGGPSGRDGRPFLRHIRSFVKLRSVYISCRSVKPFSGLWYDADGRSGEDCQGGTWLQQTGCYLR